MWTGGGCRTDTQGLIAGRSSPRTSPPTRPAPARPRRASHKSAGACPRFPCARGSVATAVTFFLVIRTLVPRCTEQQFVPLAHSFLQFYRIRRDIRDCVIGVLRALTECASQGRAGIRVAYGAFAPRVEQWGESTFAGFWGSEPTSVQRMLCQRSWSTERKLVQTNVGLRRCLGLAHG